MEKKCEVCNKSFFVDEKHPYQKYCGWRCRNFIFKIKNPEKVALYKKREKIKHFDRYQEIGAIYKDKRRFGGNKRSVMERDEFSCLNCGRKYPTVNLIVHHIDGTKDNQILNNLITLCRSCHAKVHWLDKN